MAYFDPLKFLFSIIVNKNQIFIVEPIEKFKLIITENPKLVHL